MPLDATAREANVIDSIKKYFVDNIFTTKGIPLSFDDALTQPKLTGSPSEVDKWVNILPGPIDFKTMSDFMLEIFCCVRKDDEGFKLAQLRDTVQELLTDTDGTYPDGMKRITFYQSVPGGQSNWVSLGALVVQDITDSGRMKAGDETKFRVLTVRLRFASKA